MAKYASPHFIETCHKRKFNCSRDRTRQSRFTIDDKPSRRPTNQDHHWCSFRWLGNFDILPSSQFCNTETRPLPNRNRINLSLFFSFYPSLTLSLSLYASLLPSYHNRIGRIEWNVAWSFNWNSRSFQASWAVFERLQTSSNVNWLVNLLMYDRGNVYNLESHNHANLSCSRISMNV